MKRKMKINNIIDFLPRRGDFRLRKLDNITTVVFHHSASPAGKFNSYDFATWHTSPTGRLKAPAICYHFDIEPDGTINQVNELYQIAWHSGPANPFSIGIELNGNFENEIPTIEQYASCKFLVDYLQKKLKRKLELKKHSDYMATACPGKNFDITKIK